jgi:4-phospho-D-threonate 3-dehydrogenase / 4-phospho-D-erythronate 3-dehydrogenase
MQHTPAPENSYAESSPRPILALTMGDAAGIGPEVLVRAAASEELRNVCRLVAVGHPAVLDRAARLTDTPLQIEEVSGFESLRESLLNSATTPTTDSGPQILPCIAACHDDVAAVPFGAVDRRAGQAAYDCLVAATKAALAGHIDGICTAPLNKGALRAAGLDYPGHTEILGDVCGVDEFAMMLYLPQGDIVRSPRGLGVVHTTLHTSIRSVPELLSLDGIAGRIRLMDSFMRRVRCATPRVAVCALNPHAGEEGLFGDEEARLIAPAVERCRQSGINATGPLPADTLLRRAVNGEFDGVVAMYHDQGHIALKLIGFDRAVNITLGLPIVRTSPSHGTAFDIAGQGVASAEGMIEAAKIAVQLSLSIDS